MMEVVSDEDDIEYRDGGWHNGRGCGGNVSVARHIYMIWFRFPYNTHSIFGLLVYQSGYKLRINVHCHIHMDCYWKEEYLYSVLNACIYNTCMSIICAYKYRA